jgi:two-component system, NarL family, nitrate/nitrite response regulator NarL
MAIELRVLIVADNLLTRAGLAALLSPYGAIVGQTTSGAALARDIEIYHANVALIEISWSPSAMLAQCYPLIEAELPPVALLADDASAAEAVGNLAAFGVYGLLRRETPPERIALALQTVLEGFLVFDPIYQPVLAQPVPAPDTTLSEPLTKREQEVLELLATGQTNKAIARKLGITEHTVKFHVNAIMTKLGAQSRTEAVTRATRQGLILL